MCLVGYEYTHHPKLFNSTKLGRDLTKSIANGTNYGGKALATAGACVTQHTVPAEHWKSTYRGTTAESAAMERIVSKRPKWS